MLWLQHSLSTNLGQVWMNEYVFDKIRKYKRVTLQYVNKKNLIKNI